MTSLQYVVHPLPGTEEQFNDRYYMNKRKMLCKLPSLGGSNFPPFSCWTMCLLKMENDMINGEYHSLIIGIPWGSVDLIFCKLFNGNLHSPGLFVCRFFFPLDISKQDISSAQYGSTQAFFKSVHRFIVCLFFVSRYFLWVR